MCALKKTETDPGAQQENNINADLPQLKPFDKKIFYRFSVQDLLMDALFVFFSFFISGEFFSDNGIFFKMKPWQITALYCAVTLTLPYYLGYIYTRNSVYFSKRVMKIMLWTFVVMLLMVLVYLMRIILQTSDIAEPGHDKNGFFGVFGVFLIVLGPMMCMGGAATAHNEFSKQDGKEIEFKPENANVTGALLILVLAIGFMIFILGMFPGNSSFGVVLLAYIGGPVAAIITCLLLVGFLSLLNKIGIYKYLALIAKNTFPFFIICILVFWSGVAMHFMISDFGNTGGKLSWNAIIFSICVSGLVPFRIISMLNPPWRISNIIIGICTLIYFFWKLSVIAL